MTDPLDPLRAALDGVASSLEPGPRKRLAGAIATDLRTANARRVRANVTPDGAAMTPRKPQPTGGLRGAAETSTKKGRMFRRAAAAAYLRKRATADTAEIGYFGPMGRIMNVHHRGLRDRVSTEPGAPEVAYPARPVLGMTTEDRERVLDKVADAIGS